MQHTWSRALICLHGFGTGVANDQQAPVQVIVDRYEDEVASKYVATLAAHTELVVYSMLVKKRIANPNSQLLNARWNSLANASVVVEVEAWEGSICLTGIYLLEIYLTNNTAKGITKSTSLRLSH